jgi:hypothetical protein
MNALLYSAIAIFIRMKILKDTRNINGCEAAPDPFFQFHLGRGPNTLNMAATPNGLLELPRVAAFQDKLHICRMRLQDSAQKGLGLRRQIIRSLEPQNRPLSSSAPNMELLTPLPQGAILPTRTGEQLFPLILRILVNPMTLTGARWPSHNDRRLFG